MSDRLSINAGDSIWARYAEGTAGREPLKFFHHAMELSDGDDGSGRLVVDLGSGAGNETIAFLERGWRVHAVDGNQGAMDVLRGRVPGDLRDRLTIQVAAFHEMDIPKADLVFASLSLPFSAQHLEESVHLALEAVRPGGLFVGVLLGHHDTWADHDNVAPVDRDDIARMFAGLDVLNIEEEEFEGPSGAGPKHWHWFTVSARRPG